MKSTRKIKKVLFAFSKALLVVGIILVLVDSIISLARLSEHEKDLRMEAQEISKTIHYTTLEIQTAPFATNPEPKSIYATLSADEINMIETTIQHEVGAFSYEYKKLVAEIIYNRFQSEQFPNSITEVLFQDGQFQEIDTWYYSGIEPDDDTKAAVKDVFSSENPSHDCLYYYNPELSSYNSIIWFEYSGDVEYVFSWTERDWGIDYETRFFR